MFGTVATATLNFINQQSHRKESRAAEQRAREAILDGERRAREAVLNDEMRARAFAATARAGEALSKLLLLERNPDHVRESELNWRTGRGRITRRSLPNWGRPTKWPSRSGSTHEMTL